MGKGLLKLLSIVTMITLFVTTLIFTSLMSLTVGTEAGLAVVSGGAVSPDFGVAVTPGIPILGTLAAITSISEITGGTSGVMAKTLTLALGAGFLLLAANLWSRRSTYPHDIANTRGVLEFRFNRRPATTVHQGALAGGDQGI